MRKWLLVLAGAAAVCSCIAACLPPAQEQRAQAKHVVLIVWDGMRADFVTEEHTPNLWKMGQEGVVFRRHHSVYPTATNVNGTAMATGVFPARSGVIANQEYRPAIDAENPVDTAVSRNIRKGDEASGGRYLAVPTVPEILQRSGRRTAIAGTKWITTLFNRQRVGAAEGNQVVVDGKAWPEATQRALDSLGDYPEKTLPNNGQDRWTTDALTESLWKDGVPDFSLLWLSDPDFTAHAIAPGSPEALSAIRHSDAMLGRVLQALEAKGVRAQTDVFVVSDHGFSTIERAHDVPALLREAGFRAAKKFEGEAAPGSILVAGNAGTTLFYVIGRDEAITRRLVEWLQQSDFAGV
ncbi:MAG TPA: alkaline phosphatase family protein, partial [Chthoniobacterales bacterium]|nr:alkaline phosphatase family protein [Chthoniobacterales bacterium]